MAFLSTTVILKATFELTIGICIKLLIDNGRIHWRDLINDLFFWVPGVNAEDADGLTRQVTAMASPQVEEPEFLETMPLAAK